MPFDSDRVAGENAVQCGRACRRSAAVELPEVIPSPAKLEPFTPNLKRFRRDDCQKVRDGESSITRVKDHLLAVVHNDDRSAIAERIGAREIPIRRVIEVNGRCAGAIDDAQATVCDHALGDRVSEECEERCGFVLRRRGRVS